MTGEAYVVDKILVAPFLAIPVLLVIAVYMLTHPGRKVSGRKEKTASRS